MATIGQISVGITADTSKFQKGLARSRKQLKGFSKSIGSSMKQIAGFGAALAGVGGGLALSSAIRTAADEIDRMAKLSQRLDIPVEKFAGLELAAKETGTSMETVTKGLVNLGRRTSEAADGLGTGVRAFQKLGLHAATFKKLSIEKQFESLAVASRRITNQSEKIQVFMDLFGRAGADMIPLLSQGAAGLRKFQKRAEELGLSVSQGDAAKIEKFNDEMTRLQSVLKGSIRDITIAIAPGAAEFVEGLTAWIEFNRQQREETAPRKEGESFLAESALPKNGLARIGLAAISGGRSEVADMSRRGIAGGILTAQRERMVREGGAITAQEREGFISRSDIKQMNLNIARQVNIQNEQLRKQEEIRRQLQEDPFGMESVKVP